MPETSVPPPVSGRRLTPWRGARLWVTLLWSLTLAGGVTGWDAAERHFSEQAADRTLLLMPERAPSDTDRRELERRLAAEPGVAGANWRSPAELATQAARRFPPGPAGELFSAEAAWLPWLLEVRWRDPLDEGDRVSAFLARRDTEKDWRLTLWDGESISRMRADRRAVRVLAGFWLVLAGLTGALALLRLEWPGQRAFAQWFWQTVLGVAAPAAVWAAASLAAPWADLRSLALAAAVGFLLAGAASPMLKIRQRHLSLTVGEDDHERQSDRAG